mmetsp:Transcript_38338/g.90110  ORF Transcript_38338/g.90110 Transcript_38338/m.90110 type:complete len:396 (-) Transcript_38338:10-1197(-)
MPPAQVGLSGRSSRARVVRRLGAVAAAAGLATFAYFQLQKVWRSRRARGLLQKWTEAGPAEEPVVECEVPISHGMDGKEQEHDIVEVPVGLLFECEKLRAALCEEMGLADDEALVEALAAAWSSAEADDGSADASTGVPELKLPWLDLAALAQLTYWYDRRQSGWDAEGPPAEEPSEPSAKDEEVVRPSDAKFGRWTKKVSREQVIYGAVALRYRTRGHLGAQVFRRPAGIDVTRLRTLHRAASLCRHDQLLKLVERTMEQLKPEKVARIAWDEVKKHTTKDDLWLLIDRKVYDVTPFLDLHPGGGQLIVSAAGKDATSIFEKTHGEGLRYSLRLLNQFFVGVCDGAEEAEPADPDPTTPEFLETLRSITGALHEFDEAKATGEAQGLLRKSRAT